jgi:hypothetical protein
LTIKPGKCSFLKDEVHYLGHVISAEGLKPDPAKIDLIRKYIGKQPTSIKDVRSFLGLLSYYRSFVKNFAKKAEPLVALTRKDEKWRWTKLEQDAWNDLVECLVASTVLRTPDFNYPFILQTDASGIGLGAVLSQRLPSDPSKPEGPKSEVIIGCASRTLSAAERLWPNHEREALGVIWGCEYFRPFLWGAKFEVVILTDNNAVTWLRNNIRPGRLTNWALRLAEFDFEIKHVAGSKNGNADYGSRMPMDIDTSVDAARAMENGSSNDPRVVPGLKVPFEFPVRCYHTSHVTVELTEEKEAWKLAQYQDGKLSVIIEGLIRRNNDQTLTDDQVFPSLSKRNRRKLRKYALNQDGVLVFVSHKTSGNRNRPRYAIVVPDDKRGERVPSRCRR